MREGSDEDDDDYDVTWFKEMPNVARELSVGAG